MQLRRCSIISLALLTACDQRNTASSTSTNTQSASAALPSQPTMPTLPEPSAVDASAALRALAVSLPPITVIYFPVSKPHNCHAGLSNGQTVVSCDVCAVQARVLQNDVGGFAGAAAARGEYSIVFKRAIAYNQPDVTPLDSTGVWVPVTSLTPGPFGTSVMKSPPFQEINATYLTADQIKQFGLRYVQSPENPLYVLPGEGINPSAQGVVRQFVGEFSGKIIRSFVGSCPD